MRTKEAVNTTVDSELKHKVEDARRLGLHNYSFGELLDMKMRELLVSLNQPAIIDQEIARKGVEISRLATEQSELEILKEKIRNLTTSENKNNDSNPAEELEQLRLKVAGKLLKVPYKSKNPKGCWTAINKTFVRDAGKFKDTEELEAWVISHQKGETKG